MFKHSWDNSRWSGGLFSLKKKINISDVYPGRESTSLLCYSPISPLNFHIFIWKQIFCGIFLVMDIPTFEPNVLNHLLKYWHQTVMCVSVQGTACTGPSLCSCLLSSNFCMAFFPTECSWSSRTHPMPGVHLFLFMFKINNVYYLSEGIYLKNSLAEARI